MSPEDSYGKKSAPPDKVRRPEELTIYENWCKRCGICAAFCPTGALEMGPDGPEWKHPDQCVGCRACELRCPDFAIEVLLPGEKEDASAK
ncbi:MAG: 4Fe-4S binding protein [Proteobacteria bacterium]|nr:4Fe-4S binding protein [Pseudomonadota bacterium]